MTPQACERRIGIAELEQRLDVDRSTIWRWYKAEPPKFPKPHFLAERRVWFLAEVEAWEREKMARLPEERRAPQDAERALAARGAREAQP